MSKRSDSTIERILTRMVRYRSYPPYEREALPFLTSFLKRRGFPVRRQPVSGDRQNLLAEKGTGQNSALVYMHIDTVPPGNIARSTPLRLRRDGDRYVGLGCFDMKGGIAAFLSILGFIDSARFQLKLAFCVDEEGESEGVYTLSRSSFVKNVVVAFSPEASLVPAAWELPVTVATAGRGRCVVEVRIPGKISHGAHSDDGMNAIDQAAVFITHFAKKPMNMFVRGIHGEANGLSLPDAVNLDIDCQLVDDQTPENAVSRVKAFLRDLYARDDLVASLSHQCSVRVKPRKTPYILPYRVSPRNKYVRLVGQLTHSLYGRTAFDEALSVADQNVLVNSGIPTITVGPIGGNAHNPDEWVSVTSLDAVARFYRELFSEIRLS